MIPISQAVDHVVDLVKDEVDIDTAVAVVANNLGIDTWHSRQALRHRVADRLSLAELARASETGGAV